jgi:NADPH-dependent curcumin reductase CurA
MKTRQWRMRRRTNVITLEDFELVEIGEAQPRAGQVMVRTLMLALDPYLAQSMKTWLGETPHWADGTIHGRILAEVVETRNDNFDVGDLISGLGAWQEHQVCEAGSIRRVEEHITPPSLVLGALGASGWSAWVGLRLADLEPGETMLVSAATGTVGSIAGQLASQRGCRVIGLVGGERKRRHALDVLGFDACVDHTAPDLQQQIAEVAGNGIDAVFENVGTPSMDAALPSMTQHGRIILCGLAAHYNSTEPATMRNLAMLLYKQIAIMPFAIAENRHLLSEARRDLQEGILSGAIKYDETITEGFLEAPQAYLGMLTGAGLGKRLHRIAHRQA